MMQWARPGKLEWDGGRGGRKSVLVKNLRTRVQEFEQHQSVQAGFGGGQGKKQTGFKYHQKSSISSSKFRFEYWQMQRRQQLTAPSGGKSAHQTSRRGLPKVPRVLWCKLVKATGSSRETGLSVRSQGLVSRSQASCQTPSTGAYVWDKLYKCPQEWFQQCIIDHWFSRTPLQTH